MQDLQALIEPLRDELIRYAHEKIPYEACGFIMRSPAKEVFFMPCLNIHHKPKVAVAISAQDYVRACAMGEIIAMFHSHVEKVLDFSDVDRSVLESEKMPGVLLVIPFEHFAFYYPCGWKTPLAGREFFYGVNDCITLTNDVLAELGIKIAGVYPRHDILEYQQPGWNRVEEGYRAEGFVDVPTHLPLKRGDLVLMQTTDLPVINHCGVIWDTDCDPPTYWNHDIGIKSGIYPYVGDAVQRTLKRFRHKSRL